MRILLLAAIIFFTTAQAWALEVKSLRLGLHNQKIRIVFDLDQTADFRAFMLAEPYRMVIDLPSFTWNIKKVEKSKESLITAIRKGALNKNISRIVLDMSKPSIINAAFMLPAQNGKPNRLVIDYQPAKMQTFLSRKGRIYGTLDNNTIHIENKNTIQPEETTVTALGIPLPPPNSRRPQTKTAPPPPQNWKKPLIIIDPGHGGVDPGAIGHGKIYEKNVVLALAKELKKQLEATGKYRAILTRNDDVFIRLKDRVTFARENNGDLFISLHADSIKEKNVRGTSVYTLSKKASDAQTAKLAEKENRADLIAGIDLDIEDQQVAFILGDFLMTETQNQSNFLANTLVEKLKNQNIRTLESPHRYAGFAVLKAPDIPSILIETGFMSNKAEAQMLNKASHRQKIANAILAGIDTYFAYAENNRKN